jgi:glycosyltransferase involved in cell wall biosynthesis
LLRKKKPNYLIIHLITSLPLFLNLIFNYQTKIILRISGLPKLNFFRKFFWKIAIKKIYFVTCPTEETRKFLILNNLVNKNQAIVLYDPIIDVNNNKFSKKKITYYKKNFKDYLLCVGRLTDQKNFSLMIKSFKYISSKKKNLNLVIAGEGEQRKKLIKLIKNLDLEKKVFLIGHNKDIFELFRGSKIFCLTSLWEDPGFVLIEAAFLKINIVSTKCPNGPQDFFKKTKYAYNFKTNDLRELNLKLLKIITNNYKVEHKFKKILFDKSLNYTLENHFKIIKGILI